MILLGKIGRREVALRWNVDLTTLSHYEVKLLPRGTIKKLIGRNVSILEWPVPYLGIGFERMFGNFQDFKDDDKIKTTHRHRRSTYSSILRKLET